jgi:hypothetical protein
MIGFYTKSAEGEAAVLVGEFLAEGDGDVTHDFHAEARVTVNEVGEILMFEGGQFHIGAGDSGRAVGLLCHHRNFADDIPYLHLPDQLLVISRVNVNVPLND